MTSRGLFFAALNSNRQIANEADREDGGPGRSDCSDLFSPSVNALASDGRRRFGRAFSLHNGAIFNSSSPIIIQKKLQFDVSPMNTLSPVSSLALDLNSTNLSGRKNNSRLGESFLDTSSQFGNVTCRKLSLCGDACQMSDTSSRDVTNLSFKSFPPTHMTRRASHLSCSLSDSIQESAAAALGDFVPLPSPSPPSPANTMQEKENCLHGTPKDKLVTTSRRRRRSPLKNISNLGGVSRALCFSSPVKKAPAPAKKDRLRASEPFVEASPPDDPDPNSQDSGYSESATKSEDARLRDTSNVAPRKLNLDTPTKVKFTRLNSLKSSQDPAPKLFTVFPTEVRPVEQVQTEVPSAAGQTSGIVGSSTEIRSIKSSNDVSPPEISLSPIPETVQAESSHQSKTKSSLQSSDLQSTTCESEQKSSTSRAKCTLQSLVTETSSLVMPVQESEDDLYMHELYSLEESVEMEMPGHVSNSPKLQLGALLSGEVINTVTSDSVSDEPQSSPSQTSPQPAADSDTQNVDDDAKIRATSKKLFNDEPDSGTEATPMSHRDTEIIVSVSTASPDASRAPSPMAFTPSPQLLTAARAETRVGNVLCTDMEVSPFNPNARLPIRRALSLCDVTPPLATNVFKIGASPNHAFKRPLPPSEVSPFLETKRHKPLTGTTPVLPRHVAEPCSELALKPLPVLKFDVSPSNASASSAASVSPPTLQRQQSDASPELPASKQPASENGLGPMRSEAYSLVVRQFSAPVTVDACNGGEGSSDRESLPRTVSESHLSIMKALSESQNREDELTGDFGRCLSLPVLQCSRNPDIKSITPETMAQLINGHYKDIIESYQILDCRYPYEFEGGHIIGAESWHSPQFVVDYINKAEKEMPPTPSDPNKRHILIFHCEFSAERGPRAQRLLRERDRNVNKDRYPALHFPETYLLEGGYKAFFERYPKLCVPEKYTRMMDAEHAGDLKLFRARSKSWALENKQTKARHLKRFNRE